MIMCSSSGIKFVKVATVWLLFTTLLCDETAAASIKMDFLPFADVRTDPIVAPDSLSDHVHTFYGATAARPETTYTDLRNAYGNSGNVEENKSLYWHPTIYKVHPDGTKTLVNMYIGSAYYIWQPGSTTAFPNGFKMIAVGQNDGFFPNEPTDELEQPLLFPDCWDGVNIDSPDHMSHVAYSTVDRDVLGTCPPSHPVKIPQIQFFVRVSPYTGGPHIFSDGSTRIHADYFSGWDGTFLQGVLDGCTNDSFHSAPDQWCEDFLTFRDLPKQVDPCGTLESEFAKIAAFQPNRLDTSAITDETINNIINLPRGENTGTLKPLQPGPVATMPPQPVYTAPPVECDEGEGGGANDGGEEDGTNDEGEEDETNDGGEADGTNDEDGEQEEDGEDTEIAALSTFLCKDDFDGTFLVNSRMGWRDCSWLATRPQWMIFLCDKSEDVMLLCPQTCLLC